MLIVPEAARRSGRNPETIRRWIRSGRLRSRREGRQHLVDEADLAMLSPDADLPLPDGWDRLADGSPRPDWAEFVRDSRRSH